MYQLKVGLVPSFRFRYTPWTDRMRAESIRALEALPGVEIVAPRPGPDDSTVDADLGLTPHGAVNTLDQGEALAAYFQRKQVDALVIVPLDFGDERSAAKVAELLRVPVLLYATKEPPALDEPGLGRQSDAYCGTLSIASALYRRRLPFHFGGIHFPDETAFQREAETFVRAAAVVKGLRQARIGQIGVRPPTFETVGYDEAALIRKFGQNVIYAELSDLMRRAEALPDDDPEVERLIAAMHEGVATVAVAEDYQRKAAKLEAVLAGFWEQWRLSAMAIQCWPSIQQLLGISLCALYGRLTERHMLTACETDVLGALAMMTCYHAALGETLPHFIDWTIQHRKHPNRLLAWHCGNAPTSLARDPQAAALRSRRDMTDTLPVDEGDPTAGLFHFQIKSGPVTFCRLAEYDDAWKMLISRGEIIPSDENLAGTWAWVEVSDHARLYRTLVEEGFIHHASMVHGDLSTVLQLACKFLDIEPIEVG